jgi:hypothetical protein
MRSQTICIYQCSVDDQVFAGIENGEEQLRNPSVAAIHSDSNYVGRRSSLAEENRTPFVAQ